MEKPKGYANSIMQDRKECYLCHDDTSQLDPHEIYFGSKNRQVSIDNGFWIWLRRDWHNENSTNDTPHNNTMVDSYLKETCQEIYEEKHSRESFIRLVGRSYL